MQYKNFNRREFVKLIGLSTAATVLPACQSGEKKQSVLTIDNLKKMRKVAAFKKRRIIMNNDGNDCRNPKPDEPRSPENFLSKRTSPLLGSHVDAIFYCTGVFNLYSHNSEESEILKHSDKYEDDWASELIEQGRDTLQIMVDFCHEKKLECFWTMRMNDTHDSGDPAMLAQWKSDHPDYMMGKKTDKFKFGGGRWSAVNYAIPEVRDKVFRIFQDVCTRYDVDGIEMDFFRHPILFKPQMTGEPVTQEHCDQMTDLVRRIRKMTEEVALKRGRPILISTRIADSIGFAKSIGLDLAQWLKGDLIDIVSGSGYFHLEPWTNLVTLGKKYNIPVYACLSASRLVDSSRPESQGAIELWRGEALNAWKSGVNGIYTFNRFNPYDPIFRELGDPKLLESLDHIESEIFLGNNKPDYWLKDGMQFVGNKIQIN
jgi:hypothetical protein